MSLIQKTMPMGIVAFSLVLLVATHLQTNSEVENYLISSLKSENCRLLKTKTLVEDITNKFDFALDSFECIDLNNNLEVLNIDNNNAIGSIELISLDGSSTAVKWSNSFLRKFKSGTKVIHMSDLFKIAEDRYIVVFENDSGKRLELIYKDKEVYKRCVLSYFANH